MVTPHFKHGDPSLLRGSLRVLLFRARLGFLFGRRSVVLEHKGRRTGRLRRTPLVAVGRSDDSFVLCSNSGPDADWYRNVRAGPPIALWVGWGRYAVTQRFLAVSESATVLARYESAHPQAASRIKAKLGLEHDGTHTGRLRVAAQIPMVEMRLNR